MSFSRRAKREAMFAAASGQLIDEAAALLSGDLVEYLGRYGAAAPGWAWLNTCAHADLPKITSRSRMGPPELSSSIDVPDFAWRSAEHVLMHEVVELVDADPVRLAPLQAALARLELRLMAPDALDRLTAGELVQHARAAFRSSIS